MMERNQLQFSKSTKPSEGEVQHKKQGLSMPKVSVIIPTYNYGKYIEKAVDSVLTQTYRDQEIIVVDDGSTDNTREIIEARYKDKVRYFYQENRGAPAARNFGLRKAEGEFVTFLDADDWLMPNSLAVYEEVVVKGRGEAGSGETESALKDSWILMKDVNYKTAIDALRTILGKRESEVIIFCKELKMATLPNSINSDLSKGFTVSQVAEKHNWTEPMEQIKLNNESKDLFYG